MSANSSAPPSRKQSSRKNEETLASEVIAASLGGAISASVLYPLEVLKTNMQGDNESGNETMISYASKLYQRQGISVFIRGFETSALQSATEKALYFFAYTSLKQIHRSVTDGEALGTLTNLILGCAAEWAHLPISLPIDAWTTRIQTTNEAPMAILLSMLREPNKGAWYNGLSAYTLLCLKPALQYTVYEQVKAWKISHRREKTLNAGESFLLGMVARTIATVLVFPCLRAKVILQTAKKKGESESDDKETEESTSVVQVLQQVYDKDGFGGFFQGLGPELTRGIFSAALMLMLKEQVAVRVRKSLANSS